MKKEMKIFVIMSIVAVEIMTFYALFRQLYLAETLSRRYGCSDRGGVLCYFCGRDEGG